MAGQRKLIVFSGLKHSGKSTLARLVAQRQGMPLLDLDQVIARLAVAALPELGPSGDHATVVRQLYRGHGKAVFQDFEARAAAEVGNQIGSRSLVLALGGGTMENGIAMKNLGDLSLIIFLDSPCDILFERIMRGGLPAFLDPADPEGSFRQLFERRRSLALGQADQVVVLGNKSIEQAYDTILPLIKEYLHGR